MTQAVQLASYGSTGQSMGFKNRIINGAMMIDQRNAGAAVTTANSFPVDRFQYQNDSDATLTLQQSSTAPAGFSTSLSVTVSTADASVGATQYSIITQRIEGYNTSDFCWGTASAKTVTLSFWVRSSVTGTFSGVVNNTGSSRSYPFTYTISSANTWEQKSITIAGDTSGTWLSTNGIGLQVRWSFGVGSTYAGSAGSWSGSTFFGATGGTQLISTAGATFYITGVQLEVGSTATSFDYRPYGTELALCQRYFQVYGSIGSTGTQGDVFIATYRNSSTLFMAVQYEVPMRTTPSFTQISVTGAQWSSQTQDVGITSFSLANTPTPRTAFVSANSSGAFSAGNGLVYTNIGTTTNAFSFNAEL